MWWRNLIVQLRALVPLFTGLLAIGLDTAPLPFGALGDWLASLTLAVTFYWSLTRPDLFNPSAAFILGIVYDALTGLPLGLSSVTLMVLRQIITVQRGFFHAVTFPILWLCFAVLALLLESLRWLGIGLYFERVFAYQALLLQTGLTVVLYPLIHAVLDHVAPILPRSAQEP